MIRKQGSRLLTDETIVECAVKAYRSMGFTGLIGWHYYNEPMLSWERMLGLIDAIRARVPESRFILWTNGTVLVDDKRFDNFELVFVSNYENRPPELFQKYYRNDLRVEKVRFDDRLNYDGNGSHEPCLRPFVEFIIDAFGDVKLCCQDWMGHVRIGNIYDCSFEELNEKRSRIALSISHRIDNRFETCFKCTGKIGLAKFDKDVHIRSKKFLADYNMPHKRFIRQIGSAFSRSATDAECGNDR